MSRLSQAKAQAQPRRFVLSPVRVSAFAKPRFGLSEFLLFPFIRPNPTKSDHTDSKSHNPTLLKAACPHVALHPPIQESMNPTLPARPSLPRAARCSSPLYYSSSSFSQLVQIHSSSSSFSSSNFLPFDYEDEDDLFSDSAALGRVPLSTFLRIAFFAQKKV